MASSRGIGAATGAAHKPRKAAGATPDGRVPAEGFLDNEAAYPFPLVGLIPPNRKGQDDPPG